MPRPQPRTECEGQHRLHHAIMDAYKLRHTHDQHTLFLYIDESYHDNHTPATFYAAVRDALEHMWCQGLIKPTPSAGYFTLSSCTLYDEKPVKPVKPKRQRPPPPPYRGPRLVHSRPSLFSKGRKS
ncbi:hypothetical protein JQ543_13685 [Bradyrhizobium diazoefficiens]|nr:hypothetical protein [Bradyrhizobium diazoefficiens]MBR0848799.1 hypothetical protein [Bradyrhizobium diazoefficiens]